jgi:hypothetical protein
MNVRNPMLHLLAAAALAAALGTTPAECQTRQQASPAPVPVACPAIIDPVPSGPNQAPPDQWADPALFTNPLTSNDYHWIHSSVHWQGTAANDKWGACVFFNPGLNQTSPVDMSDWRSAVVVNNPSPTLTVNGTITYRDPQGITLAILPITLAPEATFVRGAVELRQFGPGIGSVEVQADHPIVGATLHHFGHLTLSNGILVTDPDVVPFTALPGANSLQQLQVSQDFATTLFSGPFPIGNNAPEDFLNGVLPINCVLNPNPTPTTVTVGSIISPGTPLTTQTVNLPPFGMLLDTSIWAIAEPFYLTNPAPFSVDVITAAVSSDNPILGDFLMVDVLGNGAPANLVPGGRFRMGSGMMQNSPALRLINPEHTETGPLSLPGALTPTPPVETMMSVANVTSANIGPVQVQFFARTGGPPIATLNFASLPSGAVQRITPPTALIPPNTGIPKNFAGWARVTACRPGLIGWTMREVWQQTSPLTQHFRKVYGEELNGANGAEPGGGFPVVSGGQTWIREVAPLERAAGNFSFPNWWPSYQTGVNHASANIGQYWHRFFTLPGALAGQQTFTGLQFANTSFTFIDPIVNLLGADANISGRFDRLSGKALGMEAIGDPLVEWGIPMFLGTDVPTFPVFPDAEQ